MEFAKVDNANTKIKQTIEIENSILLVSPVL